MPTSDNAAHLNEWAPLVEVPLPLLYVHVIDYHPDHLLAPRGSSLGEGHDPYVRGSQGEVVQSGRQVI